MTMDTFDLEEEKRKESSSRRLRLTFVFISTLAVLSFGVYAFFYGLGAPKNFLYGTVTAALKTFHEVFGSGGGGKLVAEIDLNGGQEQFAGALPVPGTPASAAIYADGEISAAAGEGRESNSAEPSTKIISENVSAAAAGTAAVSSSKVAKNNSGVAERLCSFTAPGEPTHELIFSEIAWMGSVPQGGETAAQAANDEWLELKNISRDDIDLAGWQILDDSGKFKIVFAGGEKLSAGGFYLLERSDDDSVPGVKANKIYSGALSNSGMNLHLFGADCALADEINASSGWLSGDNSTKATMERNSAGLYWHTSATPGGTPKAENSIPAAVVVAPLPVPFSSIADSASSTSSTAVSQRYYNVGVSLQGDGGGTVTSSPPGIFCGVDCTESYREGTLLALTATPDGNSSFTGWSGACSGTSTSDKLGAGACEFTVTSTVSVIAGFKSLVPTSSPPPSPPSGVGVNAVDYVVIAAVQITGGTGQTTDDFVKIFNPLSSPFNLKGYRLVKRAKTSTSDTSVKSWTNDTFISAGGYYTWANSSFISLTPPPDATTTASIADDNGVAIREGPEDTGTIIDAVAWGGAQNAFIEGSAYPTNPGANQILSRKFVDGVVQDTDNNSQDFFIQ